MDKKNTVLGIIFIALAFLLMIWNQKNASEQREQFERQEAEKGPVVEEIVETDPTGTDPGDGFEKATESEEGVSLLTNNETESLEGSAKVEEPAGSDPSSTLIQKVDTASENLPVKTSEEQEEEIHVLENEFLRVEFTNKGGAIRRVALKKYPDTKDSPFPYVFNDFHEWPALSISLDNKSKGISEYAPFYRMVLKDFDHIAFNLSLTPGVELVRSYRLVQAEEGADPYLIKHETRFVNRTGSVFNIDRIYVNVGTAAPTAMEKTSKSFGYLLNFAYFDGNDDEFISLSKFRGSSILGMFKKAPKDIVQNLGLTVWASVKNQFFTAILTPEEPGMGIYTKPVMFPLQPGEEEPAQGITGSILFDLGALKPESERTLNMQYYVGPKEYPRLSTLNKEEHRVMQFGVFGIISRFLLSILLGIENMVGNFGVAIIITTILIRMALWPLTAKAARSSKRMAKIQVPMKEVNERYAAKLENPSLSSQERQAINMKKQKETMDLFKKNKVNPAAGCLPILVQLPIFLGFFYMLRSASELRFSSFLWIQDLSLPDTIAHVAGFPLNPLPLVMGVSMYYQMKMTPTPSADQMQQKIFRFMPFIFLFICYGFSSGLVLYWTMSNIISILQQVITNRRKDPEELAAAAADAKAVRKPAKVGTRSTPKRKAKKK